MCDGNTYIIQRTDQGGGYLAPPPLNGYTKRRDKARRFASRGAAKRECCENERPVEL